MFRQHRVTSANVGLQPTNIVPTSRDLDPTSAKLARDRLDLADLAQCCSDVDRLPPISAKLGEKVLDLGPKFGVVMKRGLKRRGRHVRAESVVSKTTAGTKRGATFYSDMS